MPKKKFTDLESKQLLRQGLSYSEIAARLGVAISMVSERLKTLKTAVFKDFTPRSAGRGVRKEFGQLREAARLPAGHTASMMTVSEG